MVLIAALTRLRSHGRLQSGLTDESNAQDDAPDPPAGGIVAFFAPIPSPSFVAFTRMGHRAVFPDMVMPFDDASQTFGRHHRDVGSYDP